MIARTDGVDIHRVTFEGQFIPNGIVLMNATQTEGLGLRSLFPEKDRFFNQVIRRLRPDSNAYLLINGGFPIWEEDRRGNLVFNEADFLAATYDLDLVFGFSSMWNDFLENGAPQ